MNVPWKLKKLPDNGTSLQPSFGTSKKREDDRVTIGLTYMEPGQGYNWEGLVLFRFREQEKMYPTTQASDTKWGVLS